MESTKELKFTMLGLDDTGKTCLLYQLMLGSLITSIPTVGFNVENFTSEDFPELGMDFNLWDIGGSEKIIPLWPHYTDDINALIYVVDKSKVDRYQRSKEELDKILQKIPDEIPLLIFANKADLCSD